MTIKTALLQELLMEELDQEVTTELGEGAILDADLIDGYLLYQVGFEDGTRVWMGEEEVTWN